MIYLKQIKKTGIVVALAILAACSSTAPVIKSTSVDPVDATTSQQGISESTWRQAYGKQQESKPNTLSSSSVELETDVWQRIRRGFVMTPTLPLHKTTQKHLDWFVEHPEYVDKIVARARPYLHYIVSELDKRNMPMEIALLPVVESGFKPFAYSKSGAAGLWQFMPRTGKVFGLEQNWWYDGRRDVIASTNAALDYLQKLHGYFGDWQLALAAYNAGEGTVGRAIKKNKKLGKATDFWSLDLPKETTAYVPKLMAVSYMVFQPSIHGLKLSPIDNKPVLAVVDIGTQMDLALAAKLAGISSDELYSLNPGFNHWATQPEGPHRLVIPLEKADSFKQGLAGLPEKQRMRWQRHKIKPGESLGLIAKYHQTTVSVLKKANELTSNNIRAGRHLLIPIAAGESSDYALTVKQRLATTQQQAKIKRGKKIIHIVKKGDTWWDLAKAYKVGVRQLATWNGKGPSDTLSLGQKLAVWPGNNLPTSNRTKTVRYEIKSGDSLWKISQQFKVSVAQVREWNGLNKRTLLKPGQKLTLYVGV